MAWSAPMTAVAHSVFPAADFNQYVRDNLLETSRAKASASHFVFSTGFVNSIDNVPVGSLNVVPNTPENLQLSELTSNPMALVALVDAGYIIPNNNHVNLAQWSWTQRRHTVGGTTEDENSIMYQFGSGINILRTGWYDVGLMTTFGGSSGGDERNVSLVKTDFGTVTGGLYATYPPMGSSLSPSAALRGMMHLNENNTLTAWFYQNSGAGLVLNSSGSDLSFFWARFIAPHEEV